MLGVSDTTTAWTPVHPTYLFYSSIITHDLGNYILIKLLISFTNSCPAMPPIAFWSAGLLLSTKGP